MLRWTELACNFCITFGAMCAILLQVDSQSRVSNSRSFGYSNEKYIKPRRSKTSILDSEDFLSNAIAWKLATTNTSSFTKEAPEIVPPPRNTRTTTQNPVHVQNDIKDEVKNQVGNLVDLLSHKNQLPVGPPTEKKKKPTKFFGKRLKIPEGSSISLAVQVSRPDVMPGLFFQGDAIVMDAVLETPMWFELDTFANHVYDSNTAKPNGKPTTTAKPPTASDNDTPDGKSYVIGNERCYIYEQAEMFISTLLEVPRTVSQACLARMICEVHAISTFTPTFVNSSVMLELMRLLLSPSLGWEAGDDVCAGQYILAEKVGRKKATCGRYNRKCPVSLTNLVVAYLFS